MLSLWPLRYFVVLCTTRSAPKAMGCWMTGLAKVLSTASRAWCACAMAAAFARSVRRITGLVGVSTKRSFVFGRIARSIASGCEVST